MNDYEFNCTMQGYINRALETTRRQLKAEGYTDKQIEQIEDTFLDGLRWAKDELTLGEARSYNRQ